MTVRVVRVPGTAPAYPSRILPLPDGRVVVVSGAVAVAARLAPASYARGMCRNIRPLHNFEPPATRDEVEAAAVQYVRKVSGATRPSQANQAAFDQAVREVTATTRVLLESLTTNAPPKNREVEATKARARAQARYA